MSDDDLRELEMAILADPSGPPVIRGTGGLRKLRHAPASSSRGKSGGVRVCYAHFPDFALVYLCAVYPKNAQANLSAKERQDYKQILDSFANYLRAHAAKGRTP